MYKEGKRQQSQEEKKKIYINGVQIQREEKKSGKEFLMFLFFYNGREMIGDKGR